MTHNVVMPVLGMAQNTGIVVSWLKAVGDEIKAQDILLEVETDKAVMEIEAGFDGYVAEILAEAGIPIPVGDVIAVLSADKNDIKQASNTATTTSPTKSPTTSAGKSEPKNEPQSETKSAPAANSEGVQTIEQTTKAPKAEKTKAAGAKKAFSDLADRRVLASPKARRLAAEKNINLNDLLTQDIDQPFRAADIHNYRPQVKGEACVMQAEIATQNFDDYYQWVKSQTNGDVTLNRIWAKFGGHILRKAKGIDHASALVVQSSGFGSSGKDQFYLNPDQAGLMDNATMNETTYADISVIDLSSNYASTPTDRPALLVATKEDSALFALELRFSNDVLSLKQARTFLKEVSKLIKEPLRQLL